jgi:hypothetical protein
MITTSLTMLFSIVSHLLKAHLLIALMSKIRRISIWKFIIEFKD